MGRAKPKIDFDRALSDLPAPMRWREYMMRVEAVIFAASRPVQRETLAALIGRDCNLDLLIADISGELTARPYELVEVAGGYQYRTRRAVAEIIRASGTVAATPVDLPPLEQLVLTAVAYFQPITRMGVADILGRPISRDAIAALRSFGLIATGPRSPQPGAPYTYVTTKHFLSHFGFDTLRDLPDMEQLEEAGLLSKQKLLAGALPGDLSETHDLINTEERGGEDLETEEPSLALSSENL
jgi:segregation and condensation protein B